MNYNININIDGLAMGLQFPMVLVYTLAPEHRTKTFKGLYGVPWLRVKTDWFMGPNLINFCCWLNI